MVDEGIVDATIGMAKCRGAYEGVCHRSVVQDAMERPSCTSIKSPPEGRYVHNARKRGKALLHALMELLVT